MNIFRRNFLNAIYWYQGGFRLYTIEAVFIKHRFIRNHKTASS